MEGNVNGLPENESDARLARELGEALEQGNLKQYLERSTDDIAQELGAFHQASVVEAQSVSGSRDAAWSAIQAATSSASTPPGLRLLARPSSRYFWAAAASAAIIAFVTVLALSLLRPEPNQLIASSDSETKTVVLEDGSEVVLRQHSSLFRATSSETSSMFVLEGEATFRVAHDPSRNFVVHANDGTISVLGTTFVVSTWGGQTRVFLSEGSVRFARSDNSEAVVLEPGEESAITSSGHLLAPVTADEAEYVDWMQNQLIFVKKPVAAVVTEFDHHFNVALEVPDRLGIETVTGVLDLNDIDGSLANLGIILGGRFQFVGNARYVFEPTN